MSQQTPERQVARRLLVSFSGGRTSALMTHRLLCDRTHDEIVVVFANTGQEHWRTLEFVHACDKHLSFATVWLEAAINPERGQGTTATVTSYEDASRVGEPFHAMIQKYGIPNPNFPHCTRELKINPIHSYARSVLGWERGSYDTAIGIRADEFDRMSAAAEKDRIIYPLVKSGTTKADVLRFWAAMPFDLDLPEHLGNCTWCWKKSLRKHLLLARENPEVFRFPSDMEAMYPNAGPGDIDRPRRFFRKNRTVADIFALASDHVRIEQSELNLQSSCEETCEAHA